jgi:hypothetical protein
MEQNKNGKTGEEARSSTSRPSNEGSASNEQSLGRGQNLGETGTEDHEPGYVHTGNALESEDDNEVDGTP